MCFDVCGVFAVCFFCLNVDHIAEGYSTIGLDVDLYVENNVDGPTWDFEYGYSFGCNVVNVCGSVGERTHPWGMHYCIFTMSNDLPISSAMVIVSAGVAFG